jgi:hypothetical protein
MNTQLEPAGYDLLQQLESAGALTPTGLTLTDPNMPYNQAEAIGTLLGRMHMSVRFAIGDWLLFIETVYPDEWTQMSLVLGMSERTCTDYMRVSQRVPKSVRRANVDWSQHRAVASLQVRNAITGEVRTDHKAQKEWLRRVEDERMSHHQLRDALRNGQPSAVQTTCRCCGKPLAS